MSDRRIVAISTYGELGRRYDVESQVWGEMLPRDHIKSITRFQKNGQMAEVEWFRVVTYGGMVYEVNGAFVDCVKEAEAE